MRLRRRRILHGLDQGFPKIEKAEIMYRNVAFVLLLCVFSICYGQDKEPSDDHFMSISQIEDFGPKQLGIVPSGEARPLPKVALALIKDFEGWSAKPYNDPVGFCTVGYGHLINMTRCENIDLEKVENGRFAKTISKDEGLKVLEEDTLSARRAVQKLVKVNTTDHQFGALVSFTFNLGKQNFAGSHLLQFVNEGKFNLAAGEFPRWIKSKGKVLQGLVDRRNCSATLFRGELKIGNDGRFNRKSCVSLGIARGLEPIDILIGE
jgi:lysozyme